jgi:hypothetical protein
MCYKLKSFKTIQISSNGCVFFDHSAYLKLYKKYHFSKKSLLSKSLNNKDFSLTNSAFFYKKYYNQIFKKSRHEFTINCKKYSKFI